MKLTSFGKIAIATSAVAIAALFSVTLSVESAQAQPRRLYVTPYYYNPYVADTTGLPWYAVRAFYAGGPWSGVTSGVAWSWDGWDDYAKRNGIGCTPGSVIKGGDGIMYVCQ